MKKDFLNKKIPTIIGLLLVLAGIGGGVFFITQGKFLGLKAGPSATPKKIHLTNIQDNQFTVSWITDEKTEGFIKYGETSNQIKFIVRDDRDQRSGETGSFNLHYVTVRNLQPTKTYYFKIGSGNNLYDNNGQAYTITTGPTLSSAGEAKIVSGRILNQDNTPAEEVIVYLTSSNIAPISTLTDNQGRWAVFLNKARTPDLSSYAIFDPEITILKIEVEGEKQSASAITITKHAFPVPDIVLGHAPYDFREGPLTEEAPIQAEATPRETTSSQFILQPISSPAASPAAQIEITIDNPSTPGEKINSLRPEIKGQGPAYKVLTIKIESPTTYSSTVTVDENNNWSFVPPQDLTPGEHTVYVSFVDENGETKTISRNFVVLAAGESELPALTATPSAEASPSASLSPSPSISPSPITRVSMPSTEAGVPTTGTVIPTFLVFIFGVSMITIGATVLIAIDKLEENCS